MIKAFYENSRLLIITIVLIIAWGIASFTALPRQEDPTLVARVAVVNTPFPGANAQRVEALVTEILEAEIREIEEIDTLESDSRIGFSSISIELLDTVKDAQPIWAQVRDKLESASAFLPTSAGTPELIESKVKAYTTIVSLTWNLEGEPNYAILKRYAEQLQLMARGLAGTEEVDLFGDPDEEITVEISSSDLSSVGLSVADLAQQIDLSDAKVSAGQYRNARSNIAIEVDSELDSLEKIRQIPIQNTTTQFTRLSDIATVNRGIRLPPTDLALVKGKPAVVVGILMKADIRIDKWAQKVTEILNQLETTLPEGISLDVIFDQSSYVADRIDSLIENLILGAIFVGGVTFVFMGWKSALIVSIALPLSTFMVLGGLSFAGIPIHQMSVTGLIIALGLLIDNAIIVVDEVTTEISSGHKPVDAVVDTVNYLKVPLLASTITTVATFLPIALLPGSAGEFVGSIAVSVIMALIASFIISLTVIAGLAGRINSVGNTVKQRQFSSSQEDDNREANSSSENDNYQQTLPPPKKRWWNRGFSFPLLTKAYRLSLQKSLRYPLLSIAFSFIIPLIGFINAQHLANQFFPSLARDQFQIEVEFSATTAIAQTEAKILQARQIIIEHPEIKDVHWFLGESAPKFYYNFVGSRRNQAYYAQAMVQLNTNSEVAEIIQQLQAELDEQFPSARVLVRQLQQGPPYESPVEIRIFGSNIDVLRELGIEARRILTTLPDVLHVRDDLTEVSVKLGFQVDAEQIKQVGLTNATIAQQLQSYLEGATGGSILESTENLPIRVRVENDRRGDIDDIASLNLVSNNNQNNDFLSTSALGEFELLPQLALIARYNEQRVNTVQAYIKAGVLPSVVQNRLEEALVENNFQLPLGYRYEFGGEKEQSGEAQGNLAIYVPLLVMVMMAALVLSLGSFRQFLIVVGVAIGCVGAALFSLRISNSPLGFMAIVGTMGLVGIAINDTVMVLSALNENPLAKQGDQKVISEIVLKSTRHVLTTTVTTIAGFVPLLLSGDPFWQPLSFAISGGISVSSLLALYFVPAVYSMVYRSRK